MLKYSICVLFVIFLIACGDSYHNNDDNGITFNWHRIDNDSKIEYKILFDHHSCSDIIDPDQFKYSFIFNPNNDNTYYYTDFLDFYYNMDMLYVRLVAVNQSNTIIYYSCEVEVPKTMFDGNTSGIIINLN